MSEEITYTENTRAIINVGFGILSPERILALSVAEIYKPVPSSPDEPLDGTLMDPRLGSNSKAELNKITDLDIKNDPGNFGHLKLAKPVIPQLKFHDQIIQTLKMTCYKCSNILLDKSDKELMTDVRTRKSKARYKFVKDYITSQKNINCYKCGLLQPHFSKGTNKNIVFQIVGVFSDDIEGKEKTFNQEIIYNILKNITDEDCMLMGYDPKIARPDWMLWTVMPIPPPTVRPSIKLENGQQAEDDLTVILNQIINTNVSLLRQLNNKKDNEKTIEEYWSLLQLTVAAYIDNEQSAIAPVTNRSNKPLRTLRSRIKAKKGRIRNNLMGKRVDYSARSVITPDPNISINELGVPMSVAMRLDYKEIVTEFNITALTRLVQHGPEIWPGANKIKRLTSDKKKWTVTNLAYFKNRENLRLRIGDVVYRHLQDGDWVLFNRQPSLHKSSMMAHQAKIMSQGDTFRLNISVTTPYNADFDGDEMNMHVPRSYRTRVELEELASVPTQIVSPQGSSPQIGLVQDAMLGVFRSTVSDNYLTAPQVMRLLAWTSTYNGTMPKPDGPNNTWTIRSIISSVLPEITIQHKSDKPFSNVEIINGQFISGALNKESVGGKISKIVHRIWKDYGPETTRLFMDNMMNLMMQWLLIDGFSIGLIDVQIDKKTADDVKTIIQKVYQEANRKISELKEGLMTVKFSGINVKEQFEFEMTKILDDAKNKAVKITYESLSNKANRIYSTVTSGSKGTQMNVVQICSMLGQQVVDNQRIESGHRLRTSAHFPKYDLRPESKGFIESNFLNGLNPAEYLMHAISGREGVISTAIRTNVTGYIQRKLVKTMEDLSVRYDGTVRNANNFIFQHSYGLDNFDGCKLERQKLDYFRMSEIAFQKAYGWTNEELKEHLTQKAYDQLSKQVNFGREHLQDELNRVWNDCLHVRQYLYKHRDTIDDMYSPVNFAALFNRVKYRFNLEKKTQTDVSPIDVIMKVRALLLDLKLDQPHPLGWKDSQHFVLLLKSNLSSKKLLSVLHVNESALDYILLRVKELYLDGLINPGEMVGTIAAQSIGEPSTQLTLDTFHQAGIGGAKSKRTEGTDRLKEVFSVTFYPKTPAMRIYVNNNLLNITDKLTNEEAIHRVEVVVDKLQFTTLGNIVNEDGYEILYDPSDEKTVVVEDQAWLNEVREFREQTISTPWLIRFVLDSSKIQNISLHDIVSNIENSRLVSERIDVVSNDVNASSVVIRVRVALRNDDPKKELKDLAIKLLSIQIKGFLSVNGGSVDNKDVDITLADGTVIATDSADYKKYKYKTDGKVKKDDGVDGKAKKDDGADGKAKKDKDQKGGGGSSSRGSDPVEVKNKDDDKELNPISQRYIIYTEGSNMYDVFSLKECDPEYTISNDVQEILRTLGIEAAREAIIYEILEIFKDKGVTNRHLGLLADNMTAQGYLISIDRYGVNKTDAGILSKGTFEETTKIFSTAAIFGESDQVQGVSGNIMFGQMFHGGTKAFDVLLDEEMLMNEDTKLYYQSEPYHRLRKDQIYEEQSSTLQDDNEIDMGFEYKFN